MRSSEIRSLLRSGEHVGHDTRHIHDLARALARERLHLSTRSPRANAVPDLLWDRDGLAYKVAARTVATSGDATTFEVAVTTEADYLCAVLLKRSGFGLIEMMRIPWPTVLWLGSIREDRLRLRWSARSPVFEAAERL